MCRCWFFIFPFLGSCPMASRHGQRPDPWAGGTECCSLLAGHREITGGGEASIERGRSGGSRSQSRIVEPQRRPGLQIRRHLAHRRVEEDRAARDALGCRLPAGRAVRPSRLGRTSLPTKGGETLALALWRTLCSHYFWLGFSSLVFTSALPALRCGPCDRELGRKRL